MPGKEAVAFCPHCGNTALQRVVHTQYYESHGYRLDGSKTDDKDFPCAYFVAECTTCHELLLYLAEGYIPEEKDFVSVGLFWPDSGVLDASVPERVRQCYREASLVRQRAPNSFAVQVRRSLEAICDDRGVPGRNLHARLGALAEKGEIPPTLAEMTKVLRVIGNRGAHATQKDVMPGHVRVIDEFFRSIVEYVYVAPGKIRRLNDAIEGKESFFDDA